MKSFSEIETVSKRSSRAAGYPWGVAEEIGKNIRLLEMFSLEGIKNLNFFFKKKNKLKLGSISLIVKDNQLKDREYCPIMTGVSFLDQIKTLENMKEIKFKNISYPLLFLPFVSRASEVIGKRIYLRLDEKEFILNFNKNIYSSCFKIGVIESTKNISLKIFDNLDSFEENEWKELYKLSEKTFVDESEKSKQVGAGAGLTDND